MSEIYDFILFENYHLAHNHKIDLVLIARMLQDQGLRVAILDIYGEDKVNNIEGVEVIRLPFNSYPPVYKKTFGKTRLLWHQRKYYKRVIEHIESQAKNFYCGSYHVLLPSILLDIKKPCYFWGLRSSRMTKFLRMQRNSDPVCVLHAMRLKRKFMKNLNMRLFVSNEIIKGEFENLGIDSKRLVIREERCVEEDTPNRLELCPNTPTFLVIGQLRKQKHISTTIAAFKKANLENSILYLVGRSQDNYEETISKAIGNDNRIERINNFLSYKDFLSYYSKAHFVLFADEQGDSCITNGTFTEALIKHRPVIAPNHNPFSYYINKYGVGLLYTPGDVDSYADAIRRGSDLGTAYFQTNINIFLETIKFENAAKDLVDYIKTL